MRLEAPYAAIVYGNLFDKEGHVDRPVLRQRSGNGDRRTHLDFSNSSRQVDCRGRYTTWKTKALTLFAITLPSLFGQGKWVSLAPFPEPHEEVIGQGANGKMYVFAGLVSAPVWLPVGMVYEFDPATSKWTKRKPMALPAHHLALTEYRGKIYVFGGFTAGTVDGLAAWTPIDNAFEYDPIKDSWRALAPMPTKRGAAVAATVGNKMYVIGGVTTAPGATNPAIRPNTPQRVLGTIQEYDPESNTWRERATMPTPRNHTAAGVVNGKIYVIGGRIGAALSRLPRISPMWKRTIQQLTPGAPIGKDANRAKRARCGCL